MNVTSYLFGEFNNGYTQYPDDYAEGIFSKFYTNSKSTTQIAIHRDGCLMYYGYVRKLEQGRYIGFCIVINGLMLTKLEGLFSLYENTISNLVTNGQLIHFNEQGNIVTNVDRLYMNREDIDLLSESFRYGFQHLRDSTQSIPAVNYGVSKDSAKDFSIEDNLDEIVKSSHTCGYTYIYKSKGFNTSHLNSYKGVLSRLNNEKTELAEQYDKLTTKYKETIKQKKQYQNVFILLLIVLVCGVGLFFLKDNLNITMNALNTANQTNIEQNNLLTTKNNQIQELDGQNHALVLRSQEAENNLTSFKNLLEQRQPFIIRSTSFNFSTGYLSFNYYGIKNESAKIHVRAYSDDGNLYTNFADIDIYIGDNANEIYLDKYLNSEKWYSFEILKENIILGGERY